MKLLFDIETDNLIPLVTKCHIVRTQDLETGERIRYLEGDLRWKKVFDESTLLVGHNIHNFDLPCLEKLFGYKTKKTTNIHDTLLMSLVLDYNREGGHSLSAWGERLGHAKLDFHEFEVFTEEMDVYCERDVELTGRVYEILLEEYQSLYKRNENIKPYLKAEHAVAKWCAQANLYGWPFDLERAKILLEKLNTVVKETIDTIQPLLGLKAVAVDKEKGEVPFKCPKWTKIGAYSANTAEWFDINPLSGQDEDRLVEGPYSRVVFEELKLSSVTDVKTFLYRNGWKPTTWNIKVHEDGRKERTSPKVTIDSLEVMHGNGQIYVEYLSNKSRQSLVEGWVENTDEHGILRGECFTIGTPSMRARHSIIVNVPAAKAAWGKEMRELFGCLSGWKLIGCDSAGNQARGLAHYLESEEYTELLLRGDVHQYNADRLTEALQKTLKLDIVCQRDQAKRVLYAFLFGASGGKLIGYIKPGLSEEQGKKLKSEFEKAVPGFEVLSDKLKRIYNATKKKGNGYIPGIAGNKIYVDSLHKLLVYLLQAMEKATCSAACMLLMQYLEEEEIPYRPLIMMHDELDFMVPEQYAERAKELGVKAFQEGPKLFGVTIMDGGGKIGNNWYEIH
jgi:DNA polymerase-1